MRRARRATKDKFDPAKVEKRLDEELKNHNCDPKNRTAQPQHRRQVHRAEQLRIAYADRITARAQFMSFFEALVRKEISKVERALREPRNLCRNCGKGLTTVNEKGEVVSNLELLIANKHYSTWDMVCKHCQAVIKTIPALQLRLLLSEIFGRTARQKLIAEQLRLRGMKEKQQESVDNWVKRMNGKRDDDNDWWKSHPEERRTHHRGYNKDRYNRKKLNAEMEILLRKVDRYSIIYHDFMLYLGTLTGKHKRLDSKARKQIVAAAQKWLEKRAEHKQA